MDILILTRGRANKQTTWENLPPALQRRAIILAHPGDVFPERYKHRVAYNPPWITGISDKCQWVIDTFGPKVCMLDDDLVFATRRDDDATKFRESTPGELEALFKDIEWMLGDYAHVGVSAREGANRNTELVLYNGRMTRVLAYNVPEIRKCGVRFDRLKVMQDFDMTLQLLRAGRSNAILNTFVHNQNGSNTEGGCSLFRTEEVQTEAANMLAELHPGFVKVVQKHTKTAWGGKERTDVIIQWKKAYESAQG